MELNKAKNISPFLNYRITLLLITYFINSRIETYQKVFLHEILDGVFIYHTI